MAVGTLDPEPINFLTPRVSMERQTGARFSASCQGEDMLNPAHHTVTPSIAAHSTLVNETLVKSEDTSFGQGELFTIPQSDSGYQKVNKILLKANL